jgi:ABC-type dipeptide/oligopeptide/nickel transport system ATPase component
VSAALSASCYSEAPTAEAARTGAFALGSRDPAMIRLYSKVESIARGRIIVLLLGETGVGKEVLARAVHEIIQKVVTSLPPEQVLSAFKPEQRLAGLPPDQAVLVFPDELLRPLRNENSEGRGSVRGRHIKVFTARPFISLEPKR